MSKLKVKKVKKDTGLGVLENYVCDGQYKLVQEEGTIKIVEDKESTIPDMSIDISTYV